MTIQETLTEGKRLLESPSPSASIDSPALDAALLLAETLHSRREDLIVRGDEPISKKDREHFFRLIERRRDGECTAYILGRKEFRGLCFTVNPQVLVPRPDTETLVEAALEYVDCLTVEASLEHVDSLAESKSLSLLDLCTGSGALAISLKNERPFLKVSASDISIPALETAILNDARLLKDGRRIEFIHSDLFGNIPGCFDIIVSNPPYIPSSHIEVLAPETRGEPRLALDGGEDGLELMGKIIRQAPRHLFPGGFLLLEADPEQMPAIRALHENENFGEISTHKDLAGRDRVISAKRPAK